MCEVVAKYDVLSETLTGGIHEVQERHEASVGAQRLTHEQEKVKRFQKTRIELNQIQQNLRSLLAFLCDLTTLFTLW